jgi:proton-translocating NADH-quinone oxidoreductase, chain M
MEWFYQHILSLMIFTPLFASFFVFFSQTKKLALKITLFSSCLSFLISCLIWLKFDASSPSLQFVEAYSWIPSLGIQYIVGIDGLSLLLVLLTTLLSPLVLLSLSDKIKAYKEFLVLLLLLETAMLGALLAFDIVFFYVFWEAMLIPLYFIIGVWGGENKVYASTKFVLYTVSASLLMLIAALYLYLEHWHSFGIPSTSLLDLYKLSKLPLPAQNLLFFAFSLAFVVKMPLWPFHSWLPHAQTEAPTAGSVILAALFVKMGAYGFIRFSIPLFPLSFELFAPTLACLAL